MSKQVYGGGKNPPWARSNNNQQQQNLTNLQQTASLLSNIQQQNMMQYQPPQQLFTQNLGLQQQLQNQTLGLQQQMQQISQGQIFPQMAAVAYPNPRTINNQNFQTGQVAASNNNPQASSTKQRVFTGTVTKIHNDFGFVDDDVFFQTNVCVKGSNPALGDRVLVEASYNTTNMPFKWNATRIQVLPLNNSANSRRDNQTKGFSQSSTKYNAVPPPETSQNGNFGSNRNNSRSISKASASRRSDKDRKEKDDRHRDSEAEEAERRKRRDDRDRERVVRDKDRDEKDKHSPSRRRSRSPKSRRRNRLVPRYMVQIPKIALNLHEADVIELTRRYTNLYIPSDFFKTHMMWVDAFPPDVPFTLSKPCSFHVMHKEVEPIAAKTNDIQDPTDADYLFSAKVMLMSMPAMAEVYRKCCSLAEDDNADDTTFVHPTRLINFLVGLRGKNETMAIGGPWSPSLDGPNPEKNPAVLIKTAIRTCKSLTGIDLSNCTQWYRFVELYYRRSVSTHKGRQVSARVETVVIFLPDVWSCVPTRLEWDSLTDGYRQLLLSKDDALTKPNDTDKVAEVEADAGIKDVDAESSKSSNMITDDSGIISNEQKPEPTHFSELDPKSMKVTDLRLELEARGINSKGLKSQLIARLVKALKAEADKVDREDEEEEEAQKSLEEDDKKSKSDEKLDENNKTSETDEKKDDSGERKKKYDDGRKPDDKERLVLEKRYTLPDSPHIIVHPSKVAKSGKFDCIVMSLSLLLDYRPEDTKEHSFEVSLFAELFNEMLMRDFGFNIYKSLYAQPEKPKEEPKKDKSDSTNRKSIDDSSKRPSSVNENDKKEQDKKSDDKSSDNKNDKKSDEKRSNKSEHKDESRDNDDDDEDDDDRHYRSSSRSKSSKRHKMVTKDPNLLLSFVYFDQTHCGYIFEKDIEELLYTLGLALSRAQVRKIVSKVVTRNSLHYRTLTDKPKEESADTKAAEEQNDKIDIKAIASGNKRFLPVFDCGDPSPAKRLKTESNTENTNLKEDGLIMYKGGLLDIEKLISQLSRSEKGRTDTEQMLVEVKHRNSDLSSDNTKAHGTIKELNDKLSDYRSKLWASEREIKDYKIKTDIYSSLVKTIQSNINSSSEKIAKCDKRVVKHEDKSVKSKSDANNISLQKTDPVLIKSENEICENRTKEKISEGDNLHKDNVEPLLKIEMEVGEENAEKE